VYLMVKLREVRFTIEINPVMVGINEENLEIAEKEVKKTGTQICIVKTDVSKREDVETLAKITLEKFTFTF
jgi:hypothetical protein